MNIQYLTLGEVCQKASSNIAQKDLENNSGNYEIYGASGFIKTVDFYHQEQPYIAIVKDGAGVGRTMLLPARSSVIGTMQYIIPNDKIDIRYLYYGIVNMNLSRYYMGAAIPHIYFKDYQKELLPIPDKAEQIKIANTLELLDKLIDARNNQIEAFDNLVKSRFIEMFGDVIQNDRGWQQYSFSDIASSRLGKMLDAKQQTGKCAYPYLANFNVQWFRFEVDNLNQMDFSEADRQEFELRDGDLLVCEGGEIGRCAVWHNEIQPCYFQKALHRVRCNQLMVLPNYMAWWFKYNCDHKGFAAIEGAKATIAHLPGAKLKVLKVTVPPIELQGQFAAFVEATDKLKFEAKQGLEKLETLKKSLMQEYFG